MISDELQLFLTIFQRNELIFREFKNDFERNFYQI